jgi:hypothetical protein
MLTTAQLITLKAALLAETNPAFVALRNAGSTGQMAEWLNEPSTTIVWRTAVPQDEIMQNGFDWVQVDNLSVGKARIWEWLFANENRTMNPSKPNVRAGVDECWKGTTAMLAVRSAIYVHCKRPATRAEKVFATGTGTDAVPASMGWEGFVGDYDVVQALYQV